MGFLYVTLLNVANALSIVLPVLLVLLRKAELAVGGDGVTAMGGSLSS
jgi:hypothetical protein|eukprot:COSAG01_NODE_10525_length_2142_cov_2.480176_3_plen_48_part_00